ncbi:DUF5947 family protein [Actinomadura violacea]|uniref:Uncharacterized protein n=1 Tax=Actinomadura violacea TaxID=2819934 RepID=A0ABS3RLY6_9ACTN|nr:DUF5947 family protein [Actinomadura violacea]MBO2457682.1 hypothetical protein [Actinomadura violacea]
MTAGAFARLVERASAGGRDTADACTLCAAPVGDVHAHLVEERSGKPLCACRACALLFEQGAAGQGSYRLVPDRRIRLTGVRAADLGVPVGLAFFVVEPDGAVTARYPSPAGATAWSVDQDAWAAATAGCAELASIRPATEALLVNTAKGAAEQWLVPVDDCFRLVGAVRRAWTGLSGGDRVQAEIEAFFAGLAERRAGGDRAAQQNRKGEG